jgi:hypothetical protein
MGGVLLLICMLKLGSTVEINGDGVLTFVVVELILGSTE